MPSPQKPSPTPEEAALRRATRLCPQYADTLGNTNETDLAILRAALVAVREVPIPLPGGTWPVLRGSFPMSTEAWDQMIKVLGVMKAGLVVGTPQTTMASKSPTIEGDDPE